MSDLRNHPGLNYHRSGVPIVVAGDDPGSFGYNDLTVDYYMIYMAWGLDLYDLKVIANNSIKYSMIPEELRIQGFLKFEQEWNDFIDSMYANSCFMSDENQEKQNDDSNVNVTDILPPYGPNDKSIELTLYGYGLDKAICKDIFCLFNDVKTKAIQSNIDQIRCKTPLGFEKNQFVNVSLQIGQKVYSTDLRYQFLSVNMIDDHLEDENSLSNSYYYPISVNVFTTIKPAVQYLSLDFFLFYLIILSILINAYLLRKSQLLKKELSVKNEATIVKKTISAV